jgi:NAD(P)-dependent dehydrogenase (short-subunit alcohol dehydrogenase family)
VSNESAVAGMFAQIKSKFGRLDYLVNNADIYVYKFIHNFGIAEFQRVININLVGKFLRIKYAIPLLGSGGSIINISSNRGIRPRADSCAYNVAAAGIINLTQSIVLELDGTGIRVNTVSPGFAPTALSLDGTTKEEIEQKGQSNPMRRNATIVDIANAVLFLLSDKATFINGQNILVNGGDVMK